MRKILLASACLTPVVALIIGLLELKGSWDDGAITAAFSRTFADSHIIALTPLSPPVEGFSSLSWFLLLALAHPFAHDPSTYLVWMKILAAFTFLLTIPLFYCLSCKFLASRNLAAFATWLLAFSITPFEETFNGMEMNLALLLFVALVYLLTSDLPWQPQLLLSWMVASLFLATRFEAPYMLISLLIGCALSQNSYPKCPNWPFMSALLLTTCGSFVGMEFWRHARFGIWMPNTVYAKLWPPYQPIHTWRALIGSRYAATLELVVVLFALLLIAIILIARSRLASNHRRRYAIHPLVVSLTVSAVFFGLIFGKNLGHRGRMTEALLPFFILFLVNLIASFCDNNYELYLALLVTAVLSFGIWSFNAYLIIHRGNAQSVSALESEGLASEDIRHMLHQDKLTIMIPDVGGAALCCDRLRILDLALLTNPVLARDGYGHFAAYFALNRPDVVVAHQVWAKDSSIYKDGLLDNYSLVQDHHTCLYVRDDLYAMLIRANVGSIHKVSDGSFFCYRYSTPDYEFSKRKETYLLLTEGSSRSLQ